MHWPIVGRLREQRLWDNHLDMSTYARAAWHIAAQQQVPQYVSANMIQRPRVSPRHHIGAGISTGTGIGTGISTGTGIRTGTGRVLRGVDVRSFVDPDHRVLREASHPVLHRDRVLGRQPHNQIRHPVARVHDPHSAQQQRLTVPLNQRHLTQCRGNPLRDRS